MTTIPLEIEREEMLEVIGYLRANRIRGMRKSRQEKALMMYEWRLYEIEAEMAHQDAAARPLLALAS